MSCVNIKKRRQWVESVRSAPRERRSDREAFDDWLKSKDQFAGCATSTEPMVVREFGG